MEKEGSSLMGQSTKPIPLEILIPPMRHYEQYRPSSLRQS